MKSLIFPGAERRFSAMRVKKLPLPIIEFVISEDDQQIDSTSYSTGNKLFFSILCTRSIFRAEVHESRRRGSGDGARERFFFFSAHTIFSCATSLSILDQFHIRNYILVWFFSLFSAVSALLVLSGLRLIWLESFSQRVPLHRRLKWVEKFAHIHQHPSESRSAQQEQSTHTHSLTHLFSPPSLDTLNFSLPFSNQLLFN